MAALEKVFIVGGTPVSYFKDVAKQVTDQMRSQADPVTCRSSAGQ